MAVELGYANALKGVIDRLQTDIDPMHQEGMLIFNRLAEETPLIAERIYTKLSSSGDPSGREAFYNQNGFNSSLTDRIAAIQEVAEEIIRDQPGPLLCTIEEWREYRSYEEMWANSCWGDRLPSMMGCAFEKTMLARKAKPAPFSDEERKQSKVCWEKRNIKQKVRKNNLYSIQGLGDYQDSILKPTVGGYFLNPTVGGYFNYQDFNLDLDLDFELGSIGFNFLTRNVKDVRKGDALYQAFEEVMLARNPAPSAFSATEKRQCLRMYNRIVSTCIPVPLVVAMTRMEFSPPVEPPSLDVEEWIKYLPEKRLPGYDAIFVGCGPIALVTAIFAKVKNDVLNILMFEKRPAYLRTHSLRIDTDAFPGYPQGLPELDAVIAGLRGRVVPIQEVEERLKRVALSLNIQIEYVHVKNPRKLPSIFPETRMFIGADGAKSVVRKDIFGDAFRVNEVIKRLMLIQYRVREKAKVYKIIKDIPRSESTVYSMPLTLIEDRVGGDGVSKTLTFSISNEFYHVIKDARMTNPFTLKSPALPEKIRTSFFLWCGMKEETEGEVRIEGSEKITAVDGEARVSKDVIKQIGERHAWWALAGDAAISLPLQRGFNTSARAAVYLADAIAHCTIGDLKKGEGVEGLASEQAVLYAAFCARVEDLELCPCPFVCPLTKQSWRIFGWQAWKGLIGYIRKPSEETKERYIKAGREHATVEVDL